MKIDFDEIIRNLESKANSIYYNNEKLRDIVERVKSMVENNPELKKVIEDIKLFIDLIRDWLRKDYREVSQTSILMIIIAFLYLLNPFDLIPDFLAAGLIDDIAVIAYIFRKIKEEVEAYRKWRDKKETVDIIEVEGEVIDSEEDKNQ